MKRYFNNLIDFYYQIDLKLRKLLSVVTICHLVKSMSHYISVQVKTTELQCQVYL